MPDTYSRSRACPALREPSGYAFKPGFQPVATGVQPTKCDETRLVFERAPSQALVFPHRLRYSNMFWHLAGETACPTSPHEVQIRHVGFRSRRISMLC